MKTEETVDKSSQKGLCEAEIAILHFAILKFIIHFTDLNNMGNICVR